MVLFQKMQQVQRDSTQVCEVEWAYKNFVNLKLKHLSSFKINKNMRSSIDSSQEELVQVDNTKTISWIQQKGQEVFVRHGRGLK